MAGRRPTLISDGIFYGGMSFVLASVFAIGIAFAHVEFAGNSLVGGFMIFGVIALIGGWVLARWAAGGDLPPPNSVKIEPPKAPTVPRSRAAERRAEAQSPKIPTSAHEAGVAVGAMAATIKDAATSAATEMRQTAAETIAPEDEGKAERSAEPQADETRKPPTMDGPREGGGDDLLALKGVGPKLAETLNGLGYYHYDQIADWSPEEAAWIDQNVDGVQGRATRDDWPGQARKLVEDADTGQH